MKIIRIIKSMFILCLISLASLSYAESRKAEYLVVMLHGLHADDQQMEKLRLKMLNSYKKMYPSVDVLSHSHKFAFHFPVAPHKEWFKVPSQHPWNLFTMLPYALTVGLTDRLPGFRNQLDRLKKEIDQKLVDLNLDYDRLIIGGLSQGAITALTFALESEKPVRAVFGAIGLWMPSRVRSYPQNIILTNGGKDNVIHPSISYATHQLLRSLLLFAPTTLKLTSHPNDGHYVSESQSDEIVRFLDKQVFQKDRVQH